MATRCSNGAYFDEDGFCGCGKGHEDPGAQQGDLALLRGDDQGSCADPICTVCGNGLESHTPTQLAHCYPSLVDPDGAAAN